MGAFQIVFILLNLTVPAWLYFRKAPADDKPKANEIQWAVLDKNVEKVIVNGGGFPPCSSRGVMLYLKQACKASEEKLADGKSWMIEQAGPDVTFSCEVTNKYVQISWIKENNGGDSDMDCADSSGTQLTKMSPLFEFTYQGLFRRIEFDSALGARETVMISNCRKKLKIAQAISASDLSDLAGQIGRQDRDPTDYMRANQLCATYDIASPWNAVRKTLKAGQSNE